MGYFARIVNGISHSARKLLYYKFIYVFNSKVLSSKPMVYISAINTHSYVVVTLMSLRKDLSNSLRNKPTIGNFPLSYP